MLDHVTGGRAGAGPALLFIHPMGIDRWFWEACLASVDPGFAWVAVDLRGVGASPAAGRPVAIEEHAADLEALRAALGMEALVPVGCAVGAMVAVAYAGTFPQHCAALVLSNPGFRTRPEARAMLAQRAADVRSGGLAAVLPDAVDRAFVGCPEDGRRAAYLRRFAAQEPEAYALQIEGMLDADTSEHLPRIGCPALIVAGGRDGLLPPGHAEAIHARLPGSELVVIGEGAHFIPFQRPDEFAGLVNSFLRRLGSASGPPR